MPRDEGPKLASFLRQLNAGLKERAGVTYVEVQADAAHLPRFPSPSAASRSGVAPSDYARDLADRFGFAQTADMEGADQYNRRLAALAEFTGGPDGWRPGVDGAAYRESDAGVVRILPVRSADGAGWGFGVYLSEGATLTEEDGRVRPSDAPFELVAAQVDIAEAVEAYDDRMDVRRKVGVR